ncbi:MAG: hypothetical protein CVT49_09325 [candidate division Zixibacteria bacterium HGW-Zixibacteria-1]|nr:MAG: hypothetical protein CVT49_09325 [candidate division Zixibacteria bacterium HGW-Zixibacteria-1]
MENIKLSVSESGRDDNISVVRVDGVIDTLTATELEEVLDKLVKRGRYGIILDLAGVDYISSAGWGIFISRIKEIRDNSGDIKLVNMVPNVMEIYELLEFDNILSAYDSIGAARTAFGTPPDPAGLKKKAPINSDRTTIEELPAYIPADSSPVPAAGRDVVKGGVAGTMAEKIILNAIVEDPFYTISELKLVLEESLFDSRIKWWGVFRILWKNNLVSRRARFRYARRMHKRS